MPEQLLTFKFRLLPSRGQHRRLRAALEHTRDLYNAALAERIGAYQKTGRGRSYFDQTTALTELRADAEWAAYSRSMQHWPLRQVDFAFKAFFRRVRVGEKPGYPRFKGRDWFKTFGFANAKDGWRVCNGRLIIKGVGAIRLHLDRPLPSAPTGCKVKREGKHWFALLTVEVPRAETHDGPAVGIDLGLFSLAVLSTGETIRNPRAFVRAQRELRRRQRALARCRRGSNGYRKARERLAGTHAKARRTRDTHLHQVSAGIARRHGLIAIEALNVKGLARTHLAKSVHDAAWAKLVNLLRYKAERAGSRIIEVDPRYTSQTCPECGIVKPKTLSQRVHSCPCGCVLDRDVAAARVILHRAVTGPGQLNVGQWPVRAGGKIAPPGAETLRPQETGNG